MSQSLIGDQQRDGVDGEYRRRQIAIDARQEAGVSRDERAENSQPQSRRQIRKRVGPSRGSPPERRTRCTQGRKDEQHHAALALQQHPRKSRLRALPGDGKISAKQVKPDQARQRQAEDCGDVQGREPEDERQCREREEVHDSNRHEQLGARPGQRQTPQHPGSPAQRDGRPRRPPRGKVRCHEAPINQAPRSEYHSGGKSQRGRQIRQRQPDRAALPDQNSHRDEERKQREGGHQKDLCHAPHGEPRPASGQPQLPGGARQKRCQWQ